MSTIEQEIENVLRAAPKSTPPAGLKERLIAGVRLPDGRATTQCAASPSASAGWLRRWWPTLAPGAVSLACAVGLSMQQMEIRDLKQTIQDLSRKSAPKAGVVKAPTVQTNAAAPETDAAARTQQEIARLKELATQLAAEVAQLDQMRAENTKLQAQLAAPPAGFLTPEETDALAKAKEKAESIRCINYLKQMGLSMRCWAIDNGDLSPPDMLSMSNELSTPKILACPGDKTREAANGWESYSSAHCSYEYLAPSVPSVSSEPSRVLFRCPIHGHVGLCDGSVHAYVAKLHPERLVQRDGKLYLAEPAPAAQGAPAQPSTNPPPGGSNP
jgi:hypothetical protein